MLRIRCTPRTARFVHGAPVALPIVCAPLAAVLLACGDGAGPPDARAASPAPAAATAAASTNASAARRAEAELAAHAWDAFVAPVIDAADPNRFATQGVVARCGAGTRVTLDGRPLQAGRLQPRRAYSLRWTMVACRPFEGAATRLDGEAEVIVFPGARQVGAMVLPRGLVLTADGARVPVVRVVELSRPRPNEAVPAVAVR